MNLSPTKESGKFPTEAEQAAWWAGYRTSEQAVVDLLAERDALREALEKIEAYWQPHSGVNNILDSIAEIARDALERT